MTLYSLHLWKKSIQNSVFFYLILSLLESFAWCLFSLFSFDVTPLADYYHGEDNIPLSVSHQLGVLGLINTERQGYVFVFAALIVSLFLWIQLDAFLSYEKEKKSLFLLSLKGIPYRKASGLLFFFRNADGVLFSAFSFALFALESLLFNALDNLPVPVLAFHSETLFVGLLLWIFFALVNMPFSWIPYREDKVIRFFRG